MKQDRYLGDAIVLTVFCKTCTDARTRRQHRVGYVTRWGGLWLWHFESPGRERQLVEAYVLNDGPRATKRERLNAWCPVHRSGYISTAAVLNALEGLKRLPANLVLPYVG